MARGSEWKDRAACSGYDLEIFFSENITDQQYAITLCNRCPVKRDCFENSDREDFKYSVRAGYLIDEYKDGPQRPSFFINRKAFETPEKFEQKVKNRLASTERKIQVDWSYKLGTECKEGHLYTDETLDGYGRCKTCMSIKAREKRARINGC